MRRLRVTTARQTVSALEMGMLIKVFIVSADSGASVLFGAFLLKLPSTTA